MPTPALADATRTAAERALQLAPGLPDGWAAMSNYFNGVMADNAQALAQAVQGLSIAPNDAGLLTLQARAESCLGRWDQAIAHLEQARSINTRSVKVLGTLGSLRLSTRRHTQAIEAVDAALALSPADAGLVERKAMAYLAQGDLGAGRRWLTRRPARPASRRCRDVRRVPGSWWISTRRSARCS